MSECEREGGREGGREGSGEAMYVSEWMDSYLCCYGYTTTAHLRLDKRSQQFFIPQHKPTVGDPV